MCIQMGRLMVCPGKFVNDDYTLVLQNPCGSVVSVWFLGPDTSSKATFGVLRLVRYLFETRDA